MARDRDSNKKDGRPAFDRPSANPPPADTTTTKTPADSSRTTRDHETGTGASSDQKQRQDQAQTQRQDQQRQDSIRPAAATPAAPPRIPDTTTPQNPTVTFLQENSQAPDMPDMPSKPMPMPPPKIPINMGISGGPTRKERYLDLHYPSEFYGNNRFDEVFRYAAKNPYSYVHPYIRKPEILNIVRNRK
jgi:hypothetical protein